MRAEELCLGRCLEIISALGNGKVHRANGIVASVIVVTRNET
jgi:hypothetical protein